mmetsp:Transcript_123996/g.355949  ORF Transcript_123996/g.355949 Transcript_123996/m.355949 type:complete len:254 (-) Transcript_123996:260-1021(-)
MKRSCDEASSSCSFHKFGSVGFDSGVRRSESTSIWRLNFNIVIASQSSPPSSSPRSLFTKSGVSLYTLIATTLPVAFTKPRRQIEELPSPVTSASRISIVYFPITSQSVSNASPLATAFRWSWPFGSRFSFGPSGAVYCTMTNFSSSFCTVPKIQRALETDHTFTHSPTPKVPLPVFTGGDAGFAASLAFRIPCTSPRAKSVSSCEATAVTSSFVVCSTTSGGFALVTSSVNTTPVCFANFSTCTSCCWVIVT